MDFALDSDGKRIIAAPNSRAICPICNSIVIAKCGELNVWHWAHDNKCDDSWEYEPKTKWHIDWQNQFSKEQQEVVIVKHNQKHIADIKNKNGLVIEIQNSNISTQEIHKRESFYDDMIWVINTQEFKHNFKLRKNFGFDFDKEAYPRIINSYSDIKNAAHHIAIPYDDFNKEIEKVLQAFYYKPYYENDDSINGEDQDEIEPYLWYIENHVGERIPNKQVLNVIYSCLFDRHVRDAMEGKEIGETTFSWSYFRKTWLASRNPKFLDLNNGFLIRIITLYENGNGFGRVYSKKQFLKDYR